MLFSKKAADPVDRAIAEIDRKIADLQRQAQHADAAPVERQQPPPAPSLGTTMRDWFTPPSHRPAVPSKRDIFDVHAEPLKELESDAFPFGREPDLFQPATAKVESEKKLARYLGADGRKPFKPLKHVQQQNRRKFYLWVGLSIIVVILLLLVVR